MISGLGHIPADITKSPSQVRQQIWPGKSGKQSSLKLFDDLQNAPLIDLYADDRQVHCGVRGIAAAAVQALHDSVTGPNGFKHFEVLEANTGWEIDADRWAERAVASKRLANQSEKIATDLESMGVKARLDSDISVIGAVSGIVEKLPVYPAIRFIPLVAARDRRPILNGMRYFIAKNKASKYFRYAVFTAGDPVPFGGLLREEIQALSRRISKWAHWARKEYDIEVLFRGVEFTRATAGERGMLDRHDAGTVLYHVHANVLYWPHRKLKDHEWSKFLAETRKRAGAIWKDNGTIRKPEEIVKYCMKPNDIEAAPAEETLWLYQQTTRLKICQPMGSFKIFMAELEELGEKIVRVRVLGQARLCRVKKSARLDHSRKLDDTPISPETQAALDRRKDEKDRRSAERAADGVNPTNLILGLTLPQWRHMPYAEPMIMVQRYSPSADSEGDKERLAIVEQHMVDARLAWDAAEAPEPSDALWLAEIALSRQIAGGDEGEYKVHTCRPTVPGSSETDQIPFESELEPEKSDSGIVSLWRRAEVRSRETGESLATAHMELWFADLHAAEGENRARADERFIMQAIFEEMPRAA